MKPKSKNKIATQSQLADALGVSRQLIAAHQKRGNTPKLDDVTGWHAFLAAHGRSGSAPVELRREIAAERLAILKASREKLERENQVAKGELMPCADAVRQATEACHFLAGELDRLKSEIPPTLAGLDAISICKILDREIEKIRTNAKEKFQSIGQ
jgi:DNA-binding XRE family transcriptional regulator